MPTALTLDMTNAPKHVSYWVNFGSLEPVKDFIALAKRTQGNETEAPEPAYRPMTVPCAELGCCRPEGAGE